MQFDKTSVGLQPKNISKPNDQKSKHESDSNSHSISIILSSLLCVIFVIAIVAAIYHYWNQRRIKETSSELLVKIIFYKKFIWKFIENTEHSNEVNSDNTETVFDGQVKWFLKLLSLYYNLCNQTFIIFKPVVFVFCAFDINFKTWKLFKFESEISKINVISLMFIPFFT